MSGVSYNEYSAEPCARIPTCPKQGCHGLLIVYDTSLSQCTKARRVYRCNKCRTAVPLYRQDWPRIVYRVPHAGCIIDAEGSLVEQYI